MMQCIYNYIVGFYNTYKRNIFDKAAQSSWFGTKLYLSKAMTTKSNLKP